MSDRILLVDDEPNVLHAFQRHLRHTHKIELAIGGPAALEAIKRAAKEPDGGFAVVVSDMQMPELSGAELLAKVQDYSEHTVRIMLTGNADHDTAAKAVNEGQIFRFLSKPCPPGELAKAIDAGLEHHRLIRSEAELLRDTLSGSVRMLTQVLSMAMPDAFGWTQEARTLASEIADRLGEKTKWQVEMAAMLMRIGCVSLPADVRRQYLSAEPLSPAHASLVDGTPALGANLVGAIPRLEPVAKLIGAQFDPPQAETPLGARILRVVGDFQRRRGNASNLTALGLLRDPSRYDPAVVDCLHELVGDLYHSREVTIGELSEGMILESNVEDEAGRVLVATGTEVHESLIQKLMHLRKSGAGVHEPLQVRAPGKGVDAQSNESSDLETATSV